MVKINEKMCMEAHENQEPEFWSVYTAKIDNTLDCIADFDSRGEAGDFVEFLTQIIELHHD